MNVRLYGFLDRKASFVLTLEKAKTGLNSFSSLIEILMYKFLEVKYDFRI